VAVPGPRCPLDRPGVEDRASGPPFIPDTSPRRYGSRDGHPIPALTAAPGHDEHEHPVHAMTFKTYTLAERPGLEPEVERLAEECWPRFLRQRDSLGLGRHWSALFTTFAAFQLLVCDPLDRVAAAAHSVPVVWDGHDASLPENLAAVMAGAVAARAEGRAPTAVCALAALVGARYRGQGVSRLLLTSMRALASSRGLASLVAPVRLTLKERYPLAPMERYVRWTRDDEPFDPWVRTHARLGARLVRVIPRALVIEGSVAQWETWTDMAFPDSGPFVVPGALQPVTVDRERDAVRYEDPNVWMHHAIRGGHAA
jgi:GNAT superfamily N-acetyltransferase